MTGMIISIATNPYSYYSDTAYDFPKLFPLVDFINLMTYDLHGGWETVTNIHTALFSDSLSVDMCVKYWVGKGAPRDKLNMGMAFYGNGFVLKDPKINGYNAPVVNGGGDLNLGFNTVFLK